jgi:serine/threonine-protein kinase HipA
VADAAKISPAREFELIRRLGEADLPGAVRVLEIAPDGSQEIPALEPYSGSEQSESPFLKFSLAGAQLKASVFRDERGMTVPIKGTAGNFILKFPDGRAGNDQVPEAEHAAMKFAHEVGIRTAAVFLEDAANVSGLEDVAAENPGLSLLVERFDRTASGNRVHTEEVAQVLDIPTAREHAKYREANFETIGVIVAAHTGIATVGEVVDRIVFNVLIGNGDAHLKNWAFIYRDGRTPVLSPAYDIVPTVLYVKHDDLGLNIGKTKIFEDISFKHFAGLGNRTGYGAQEAMDRAASMAERVLDNWNTLSAYLTSSQFDRLSARLKTLDLSRRRLV